MIAKPQISKFQEAMFAFDRLGTMGKLEYMRKKGFKSSLSDFGNEIQFENKFFHWLVDNDLAFEFEDDFLNPSE